MKNNIYILVMIFAALGLSACTEELPKEAAAIGIIGGEVNEIEPEQAEPERVKEYLKANYPKTNIDGSTSLMPLHQALDEVFVPEKDDVFHSRTVEAFEKFMSGEADILLSVDYSDGLLEEAKATGMDVRKKAITKEAFIFLVNKNNPVKNLSTEQIKDIYSGKITNWAEVGGDDAPIRAYQRNPDSGSQMRMLKFMGDVPIMKEGVEYISTMGTVFEHVERYDEGKYSIAYNMYTFTEGQYTGGDIIMLSVDGIEPCDETIFNGSYPISIENCIFYDSANPAAKEFAENLYLYLMSEEGQELISGSGYINMNTNLEVNKSVGMPFDADEYGEIGFYNEAKGEFYAGGKNGELLIYKSYADYVLHDTDYADNVKAREFVNRIFDAGIVIEPRAVTLNEGTITVDPSWTYGIPFAPVKYRYDGKYYAYLEYLIDEDKYRLRTGSAEDFEYAMQNYLDGASERIIQWEPDSSVEFDEEGLADICMEGFDYTAPEYFRLFGEE